MAKSKYIKTPDAMLKLFSDYKISVKSMPIIVIDWVGGMGKKVNRQKEKPLTMEGFEVFCYGKGVTINHYFTNANKVYDVYCDICSRIKMEIRKDQIEGGMAGIYNPSITQRLNSLVEKSSVNIEQAKPLFPDVLN